MELYFLALLVLLMAFALGAGYPVAFALPGASIITIGLAAICGFLFVGDTDAFFAQGGPSQWLSAGVTNLRGVYWEPERDTLIAIPLFIFMGIMLQRSKIAEDLLVTMAQLFGPIPGGLGISVVFVGALLAATTGIVGATVVAMGLISLPAMLRNNYSSRWPPARSPPPAPWARSSRRRSCSSFSPTSSPALPTRREPRARRCTANRRAN